MPVAIVIAGVGQCFAFAIGGLGLQWSLGQKHFSEGSREQWGCLCFQFIFRRLLAPQTYERFP
jgi:hypothetical protein